LTFCDCHFPELIDVEISFVNQRTLGRKTFADKQMTQAIDESKG